MRRRNPSVSELEDTMRLLYRSTHIYILGAGLVNMGIGSYYVARIGRWQRVVQMLGSILIVIPPVLLLIAFFSEPLLTHLQRPYTRPAIIMLAMGTLLHLISAIPTSGRESLPS